MHSSTTALIVKHGDVCAEFQSYLKGEEPPHSYIAEIVSIHSSGEIHVLGIDAKNAQFDYDRFHCRTLAQVNSLTAQIPFYLQLWKLIVESNPRLIVVVHPWELLIVPYLWSQLRKRKLVACLAKVPYSAHMSKRRKMLTLFVIRPLLRQAEVILARSHLIERQLLDWGISQQKIQVYLPPYTADFYRCKTFLPVSKQQFNIVFIGRLVRLKGIYDLLKIFHRVVLAEPDTRLYIVGDGPERATMERMAETLQIRHQTRFIGMISQSDVYGYLAPADVAVLPSYQEGLGKTALEAFLSGLPVLATAGTGFTEFVKHGQNGFLFAPGDIDEFAQALLKLIRNRQFFELLKINAVATGNEILQNSRTFSSCVEGIMQQGELQEAPG